MTTKHITQQLATAFEQLATIRNPFELEHELEQLFPTYDEYSKWIAPFRAQVKAGEITWTAYNDILQGAIERRQEAADRAAEAQNVAKVTAVVTRRTHYQFTNADGINALAKQHSNSD